MLFWLVVLLIVVSLGLAVYVEKRFYDYSVPFLMIASVGFIVAIIMLIVIIVKNTNVDAYVAENQMRYEILVYQYENNLYDNDNDLGKRDLMEDIQEYHNSERKEDEFDQFVP